mmetsp:Transcript_29404/g.69126  ORF Transcript_29404/g.69126 Transcript_29404/m.69126 type:complete len:285 (-) Transcript_29404:195-1049(-)
MRLAHGILDSFRFASLRFVWIVAHGEIGGFRWVALGCFGLGWVAHFGGSLPHRSVCLLAAAAVLFLLGNRVDHRHGAVALGVKNCRIHRGQVHQTVRHLHPGGAVPAKERPPGVVQNLVPLRIGLVVREISGPGDAVLQGGRRFPQTPGRPLVVGVWRDQVAKQPENGALRPRSRRIAVVGDAVGSHEDEAAAGGHGGRELPDDLGQELSVFVHAPEGEVVAEAADNGGASIREFREVRFRKVREGGNLSDHEVIVGVVRRVQKAKEPRRGSGHRHNGRISLVQ